MRVASKADFVPRFIAGEFGNRTQTWATVAEYQASGYKGEVCLRSKIPGAPTFYNVVVLPSELPASYYISAMIPAEIETQVILQGEVCRSTEGLYLFYSRLPVPMKQALAEAPKHAYRTHARLLLYESLNYLSYKWLMHLLDVYVDHVVEFSAYSCEYGMVPGYNTLFWEVRDY